MAKFVPQAEMPLSDQVRVRREKLESLMGMDSPWPWYGQLMRRPQTMAYFLQLDFWLRHYQVEILF